MIGKGDEECLDLVEMEPARAARKEPAYPGDHHRRSSVRGSALQGDEEDASDLRRRRRSRS